MSIWPIVEMVIYPKRNRNWEVDTNFLMPVVVCGNNRKELMVAKFFLAVRRPLSTPTAQ